MFVLGDAGDFLPIMLQYMSRKWHIALLREDPTVSSHLK